MTLSRMENRRLSCGPSLHGSVTTQVTLVLWFQSPASLALSLPFPVFKREPQIRYGTRCKSRANKKIIGPLTTSSDVSETGIYNLQHTTGVPNSETAIQVCPPYPRVIRSKTYRGYVKPRIIPNAMYIT
jgi:hypothetical protein